MLRSRCLEDVFFFFFFLSCLSVRCAPRIWKQMGLLLMAVTSCLYTTANTHFTLRVSDPQQREDGEGWWDPKCERKMNSDIQKKGINKKKN